MDQLFGDYVELYSRINKNEWITINSKNIRRRIMIRRITIMIFLHFVQCLKVQTNK